jgi:hypothetical protein
VIFQVEAEGDTIYIEAATREEANRVLKNNFGAVPPSLLKWAQVDKIPEGEESFK